MKTLLTIIFILVCIVLTVIVLAQEGKDAGLGSLGGGSSDTYWGKNKGRSAEGMLVMFTRIAVVGFLVIAAVLNIGALG